MVDGLAGGDFELQSETPIIASTGHSIIGKGRKGKEEEATKYLCNINLSWKILSSVLIQNATRSSRSSSSGIY